MSAFFRCLGDIHGERKTYLTLIKGCEHTIQLGDFDTDYTWLIDANVDPSTNHILLGNHDNYDQFGKFPHHLGDAGVLTIPGFGDIFYLRGGFSVDYRGRHNHPYMFKGKLRAKNLWDEEELTVVQLDAVIKKYEEIKPKVLIAHECPMNIVPYVTNPMFIHSMGYEQSVIKTKTNQALQAMVQIHPPRLCLFGHYHKSFKAWIDPVTGESMPEGGDKSKYTLFICVGVCKYVDFPKRFLETLE